jgi:hypothetical protein
VAAFPEEHWRHIRTNNSLERIMREIRRRTRVVGAFPDGNSAINWAAARLRHFAQHALVDQTIPKHAAAQAAQRHDRHRPKVRRILDTTPSCYGACDVAGEQMRQTEHRQWHKPAQLLSGLPFLAGCRSSRHLMPG